MDHLFIHSAETLRRAPGGTDDGTPIMGGWAPVEWAEGKTAVPGRLDTPREVTVTKDDGSTVTVQRSTWLTSTVCPAKELDRLRITTGRGTQTWHVAGVTEAEGMHGAHHLEVSVTREVGR